MGNFIDLTGKRFGRLTAIKRGDDYISPRGQRHTQWLCKCDCGKVVLVSANSLKRKLTQSCGCLAKEKVIEACKKHNHYDLTKEYGVGYTTDGQEFYFDIKDYDKIKIHSYVAANNNCVRTGLLTMLVI